MIRFAACLVFVATLASGATTPPPIDREWALPAPNDGNMWFTMNGAPKVGRITPEGVITLFPTSGNLAGNTYGICVGPDGDIWFTEAGASKVGKMTV